MLTVRYHLPHVRGLPHLRKGGDSLCEYTFLKPATDNKVAEEVLEAYKAHPEIRRLLLRGAMGGIEITAVDGAPTDHEEFLQALYEGEKLPSAAARSREIALELQAEADAAQAGALVAEA